MKNNVMVFRGTYAFLSNMHAVDFEWDGRIYHSSEAAYQSAKSLDPAVRERFSAMAGVTAKREGKKIALRPDWEDVKDAVMEEIVFAKFSQNPELAQKLADTGDMELTEGNRWHDTYWGVDLMTGKGENHLGRILMKVRAQLGGKEYFDRIARERAQRDEELRREREKTEEEIAKIRSQLNVMPEYDFVGAEMDSKSFGRVTIKHREGKYLVFDARGAEKKFALPGCIANGFLIPDDPAVVESYKLRVAMEGVLKKLEEKLEM